LLGFTTEQIFCRQTAREHGLERTIRKNLLEITPGRYRQKPEEEEDDDEDDEENKSNNSNNIPSPDLRPCQDDS
jgi:hypothetical protein